MDKRLCSFREQAVAGLVEDCLRQQGFHPRPLDTSGLVAVAGAGHWYHLWVPEEEEENAREFLSTYGYTDALIDK